MPSLQTDTDPSYPPGSELAAPRPHGHEILTLCRCLGRIVQAQSPPAAVRLMLRPSCKPGTARKPSFREPTRPSRKFFRRRCSTSTAISAVDLTVVAHEKGRAVWHCLLPFCLESAPVDWELEIGPMRKVPQLGESALPSSALGANAVDVLGPRQRDLRSIRDQFQLE